MQMSTSPRSFSERVAAKREGVGIRLEKRIRGTPTHTKIRTRHAMARKAAADGANLLRSGALLFSQIVDFEKGSLSFSEKYSGGS